MSQNQQKYDYEFIKEEYNKAERVLSDIVSILKSSFDKKYILKNEDKYIQKVIAMLIDIRKIESDIKGIYFDAENDKLEEPYKGLQEIKENVKVLKWYYDRVNLLIKSYNKLYPGTIKAADKDEDIANKCYDIKLTLKKIAVEISKMIQKSKNGVYPIDCVNFLEPLKSPIKFDYKMSHSFIPVRDRHGPFFGNIINR
ncbi:hypothetical protein [Candidatus Lariskella endosymbiont of Epinotia ramella]|uniref:hypothetical protein n=1 Tax=Candidatus Lariskella endosymbiont of Epinotia ramella TaxID=3066224 RepID=UPI0030CCCC5C